MHLLNNPKEATLAIIVDHEKRRTEIVLRSLALFAYQGYEGVTFQKIADRCGLARTSLYRYFRNKQQIFDTAIFAITERLESRFLPMLMNKEYTASQKIQHVMNVILPELCRHPRLLSEILHYLMGLKKDGQQINRHVLRHTIKMRLLFNALLAEGIEQGEFRPLPLRVASNMLYALLEATILQVTVAGRADPRQLREMVNCTIEGLRPLSLPSTNDTRSAIH